MCSNSAGTLNSTTHCRFAETSVTDVLEVLSRKAYLGITGLASLSEERKRYENLFEGMSKKESVSLEADGVRFSQSV